MGKMTICLAFILCSCNSGKTVGDGGQDLDSTAGDSEDMALEDMAADRAEDGWDIEDVPEGLDDSPVPDALDADSDSGEIEHLDLVPITPTRPAMPCGDGCRQVTLLDMGERDIEYDVWGDWLVLGVLDRYTPMTHQVSLVDLVTLDFYILDETNFSEPERPAVGHPAIWENKIVYTFQFNTSPVTYYRNTLFLVDLAESTRAPLRTFDYPYPEGSGPHNTGIFYDYVVWKDDRTNPLGGENVYMMSLLSGGEMLVSDHCCYSHAPRIYGTKIVYTEGISGGGMNVWLYDIDSGEHRQLTDGAWDQFNPDIYESTVVWTDGRNGGTAMSQTNMDVYMMDLETGEERVVTDNPASQIIPVSIWGSRVVYADCRNDPVYPDEGAYATEIDIYMMDIETGEERRLTSLPGIEGIPLIHGNRVYFIKRDLEDLWSVFEITIE
jgi:beta propeller repeat protein